jgi:hypothetical protein
VVELELLLLCEAAHVDDELLELVDVVLLLRDEREVLLARLARDEARVQLLVLVLELRRALLDRGARGDLGGATAEQAQAVLLIERGLVLPRSARS